MRVVMHCIEPRRESTGRSRSTVTVVHHAHDGEFHAPAVFIGFTAVDGSKSSDSRTVLPIDLKPDAT